MRIEWKLFFVALMTGISAIGVVSAGAPSTSAPRNQVNLLTRLQAENAEIRDNLAKNYIDLIATDSESLIAFLNQQSIELKKSKSLGDKSTSYYAIQLLGELRCDNSTATLIDLIACRDASFPLNSDEWVPHFPHFPCAIALKKIGTSAIEPLLTLIHKEKEDTIEFQLACLVLKSMLGEHIAITTVQSLEQVDRAFKDSPAELAGIELIRSNSNLWNAMKCKDF